MVHPRIPKSTNDCQLVAHPEIGQADIPLFNSHFNCKTTVTQFSLCPKMKHFLVILNWFVLQQKWVNRKWEKFKLICPFHNVTMRVNIDLIEAFFINSTSVKLFNKPLAAPRRAKQTKIFTNTLFNSKFNLLCGHFAFDFKWEYFNGSNGALFNDHPFPTSKWLLGCHVPHETSFAYE